MSPSVDPSVAPSFKLLLNKRDVAVALSVSIRTVDNLISRKELPVKRIGRRVMVPIRALVRYAEKELRNVKSSQPPRIN